MPIQSVRSGSDVQMEHGVRVGQCVTCDVLNALQPVAKGRTVDARVRRVRWKGIDFRFRYRSER